MAQEPNNSSVQVKIFDQEYSLFASRNAVGMA